MTSLTTTSRTRLPELSYATERALRALELLAFAPTSATELASQLQIHHRTARRLLRKLVSERYATAISRSARNNRVRYQLTPRLLALAAEAATHHPLIQQARPLLAQLSHAHHATALLAAPSFRNVLILAHHGPDPPGSWQLAPAHATAAGKALLAARPAWLDDLCAYDLPTCAPATITDPDVLRANCRHARVEGYAAERDELRAGRCAIAVTVPAAPDDDPVMAVSLASSDGREPSRLLGAPLNQLRDLANRLALADPAHPPR